MVLKPPQAFDHNGKCYVLQMLTDVYREQDVPIQVWLGLQFDARFPQRENVLVNVPNVTVSNVMNYREKNFQFAPLKSDPNQLVTIYIPTDPFKKPLAKIKAALNKRPRSEVSTFDEQGVPLIVIIAKPYDEACKVMEELRAATPTQLIPGDPTKSPPAFEQDGRYYILSSIKPGLPGAPGIQVCQAVQTDKPIPMQLVDVKHFTGRVNDNANLLPSLDTDSLVTVYVGKFATTLPLLADVYQAASAKWPTKPPLLASEKNDSGFPYLLILPDAAPPESKKWVQERLQGIPPQESEAITVVMEKTPVIAKPPLAAGVEDETGKAPTISEKPGLSTQPHVEEPVPDNMSTQQGENASDALLVFKYYGMYYVLQAVEKDAPFKICQARCFSFQNNQNKPKWIEDLSDDRLKPESARSAILKLQSGAQFPSIPGGTPATLYVAALQQEELLGLVSKDAETAEPRMDAIAFPDTVNTSILIVLDETPQQKEWVAERFQHLSEKEIVEQPEVDHLPGDLPVAQGQVPVQPQQAEPGIATPGASQPRPPIMDEMKAIAETMISLPPSPPSPPPQPQAAGERPSNSSTHPGYVALELGGQYYALVNPFTGGSTAMVWQARRLNAPPGSKDYEILQPISATYARLVIPAQQEAPGYADPGQGEWVAIKISRSDYEKLLLKELRALQRVGKNLDIQLHFPAPGSANATWPSGFPCIVMEWVTGKKLSEMDDIGERDGLVICSQLADLLLRLRLVAPDIVPTDSLKADGVFIKKDAQGFRVRLVDWGGYDEQEGQVYEKTLIRFGEVMTHIFAKSLNYSFDRRENIPSLNTLAIGDSEDKGVKDWDALTYGTRDLIRRVLLREGFPKDAQTILNSLLDALKEQIKRWEDNNPLSRMRESSGVDKLNWLDIAINRGEKVLPLDKTDGSAAMFRLMDEYGRAGQYPSALLMLRTAVRRSPEEARFRWATLMHEASRLCGHAEGYKLLDFSNILAALDKGDDYPAARASLERAAALLHKWANVDERALHAVEALLGRANLLETTTAATNRLQADLQIEPAEVALQVAAVYLRETTDKENSFLPGNPAQKDPDQRCREAVEKLEKAIHAHRQKYGLYLLDDQEKKALQADHVALQRQAQFRARLVLAEKLACTDDPVLWKTAAQYYDQVAAQFPDLWEQDAAANEKKRGTATQKLADHFMDEAQKEADPAKAIYALTQSLYYQSNAPEAIELLSLPVFLQRGLLNLSQDNYPAAAREFETAAGGTTKTPSKLGSQAEQLLNFTRRILALQSSADALETADRLSLLDLVAQLVQSAALGRQEDQPDSQSAGFSQWENKRLAQLDRLKDLYAQAKAVILPPRLTEWLNSAPSSDAIQDVKLKLEQMGGLEELIGQIEAYNVPDRIRAGSFDDEVFKRLEAILKLAKTTQTPKGGNQ